MSIKPDNILPVGVELNQIKKKPKNPIAVLGKFVTWNYLKSLLEEFRLFFSWHTKQVSFSTKQYISDK